jgi:hypothetical protein
MEELLRQLRHRNPLLDLLLLACPCLLETRYCHPERESLNAVGADQSFVVADCPDAWARRWAARGGVGAAPNCARVGRTIDAAADPLRITAHDAAVLVTIVFVGGQRTPAPEQGIRVCLGATWRYLTGHARAVPLYGFDPDAPIHRPGIADSHCIAITVRIQEPVLAVNVWR